MKRAVAVFILIGSFGCSSSVEARAPAWRSGKKALALIASRLASCTGLEATANLPDVDELEMLGPGNVVRARSDGKAVLIYSAVSGSGVSSTTDASLWRVAPRRCCGFGISYSWADGSLSCTAKFSTQRRKAPTAAQRRRLLVLHGYAAANPRSAKHAASRLIQRGGCRARSARDKWEPTGPVFTLQPTFSGKPRASPATYWPLKRPPGENVGKGKARGKRKPAVLLASATGRPIRTKRSGRYEIYESPLPGRHRDTAVAVYDRRTRKHRWVAHGRSCVFGRFFWYGIHSGLLVGYALPMHPAFAASGRKLIFIRLSDGKVKSLPLGGASATFSDGLLAIESKTTKRVIHLKKLALRF